MKVILRPYDATEAVDRVWTVPDDATETKVPITSQKTGVTFDFIYRPNGTIDVAPTGEQLPVWIPVGAQGNG